MNEETVKMTDHAMHDCTPLRFGLTPPEWVLLRNMEENVPGTQNQKPKEIKAGNKHYFADCYCKNTDEFLFRGVFVLGKRKRDYLNSVLSVLPISGGRSERAVSDLIRDLRIKGKIDVEYIINELYPAYKNGDIATSELFFDFLVAKGVDEGLKANKEYIEKLEAESDRKSAELDERDRLLDEKNNTILQNEIRKPGYKGEGVELSPIMTLKDVIKTTRVNAKGNTIKCTKLIFEEPSAPERTMDEWADQNGVITQKAVSLKGKKVQTSSWRPGTFNPLNWWRDIFEVE